MLTEKPFAVLYGSTTLAEMMAQLQLVKEDMLLSWRSKVSPTQRTITPNGDFSCTPRISSSLCLNNRKNNSRKGNAFH